MVLSTSVSARPHRPMAVVTGAASGIGHALVRALLDRDLDVVAIDLAADAIDPRAHRFAVDVRDADFGAPATAVAEGVA